MKTSTLRELKNGSPPEGSPGVEFRVYFHSDEDDDPTVFWCAVNSRRHAERIIHDMINEGFQVCEEHGGSFLYLAFPPSDIRMVSFDVPVNHREGNYD